MQKISQVLSTATENKNLKPTATELTPLEQDSLFNYLADLTNSQFKAWYCRSFKQLGRERVMRLASIARADGNIPSKYFSYLIRKELI